MSVPNTKKLAKKHKLEEQSSQHSDDQEDQTTSSSPVSNAWDDFFHTDPSKNWARYWVVEDKDEKQKPSLYDVNAFIIRKVVDDIAGEGVAVERLASGSLVLCCTTPIQAYRLQSVTTFYKVPVKCSVHRSKNTSKGIIRTWEATRMSNEYIQAALAEQGVIAAKKFRRKVDGEFKDTNTVLLTFDTPQPPTHIKFGYVRVKVDQFIPNPLRCFKCQDYGHGASRCKRKQEVCAKCCQTGHDYDHCVNTPFCKHCDSTTHSCSSKKCPKWLEEQAVTRIKHESNCSFFEAREKYKQTVVVTPVTGVSYTSAAAKSIQAKATPAQTPPPPAQIATPPTVITQYVCCKCKCTESVSNTPPQVNEQQTSQVPTQQVQSSPPSPVTDGSGGARQDQRPADPPVKPPPAVADGAGGAGQLDQPSTPPETTKLQEDSVSMSLPDDSDDMETEEPTDQLEQRPARNVIRTGHKQRSKNKQKHK